jgi:hypothetical protein
MHLSYQNTITNKHSDSTWATAKNYEPPGIRQHISPQATDAYMIDIHPE